MGKFKHFSFITLTKDEKGEIEDGVEYSPAESAMVNRLFKSELVARQLGTCNFRDDLQISVDTITKYFSNTNTIYHSLTVFNYESKYAKNSYQVKYRTEDNTIVVIPYDAKDYNKEGIPEDFVELFMDKFRDKYTMPEFKKLGDGFTDTKIVTSSLAVLFYTLFFFLKRKNYFDNKMCMLNVDDILISFIKTKHSKYKVNTLEIKINHELLSDLSSVSDSNSDK